VLPLTAMAGDESDASGANLKNIVWKQERLVYSGNAVLTFFTEPAKRPAGIFFGTWAFPDAILFFQLLPPKTSQEVTLPA